MRTWSPRAILVSAGHAGNGDASVANPGLQQDLRAKLLDDLDAGIEAEAGRAFAEHEMFRPHAHDHWPAIVGAERPRIGVAHRQAEAGGLDRRRRRLRRAP